MNSIEKQSKFNKALMLISIVTFIIIIIIFLIELFSYILLEKQELKKSGNKTIKEFILSKPLPFENAKDYELIRKDWAGETDCPKNRLIYNGKQGFPFYEKSNLKCNGPVTLENGLRTTTSQKKDAKNKIMFFGGSTMWGAGSADEYTIPSLYQKILNENNLDYGVYNYGFTTVVIKQQLNRLKTVSVNADDIVIFYDGGNDIWNSIVYENYEGVIIGYNDTKRLRIIINKIKFFLSNNSNAYVLLGRYLYGAQTNKCENMSDEEVIRRSNKGFRLYLKNIEAAKDYVESRGGHFFHFLQPSLVSSKPLSKYKRKLISGLSKETRCGIETFSKGYDFYKREYIRFKSKINGTDLTSLLNFDNKKEFFWDYIHVSSPANKIIAKKIFDKVSFAKLKF